MSNLEIIREVFIDVARENLLITGYDEKIEEVLIARIFIIPLILKVSKVLGMDVSIDEPSSDLILNEIIDFF